MLPWQQPESFATRIFDISFQSLDGIDRDSGIAIRSALEELMSTMPNYMCTDAELPTYLSACGGHAIAEDEFSLSFLENLPEPVDQSQTLSSPCRPKSPLHLFGETSSSMAYQHQIDTPGSHHLNGHLKMEPCTCSNSMNAMHKPFSSSFVSGESPGICFANTDTSFIHPSPAYSEASTSFAVASQHDSFHMRNHDSEHLDTHVGMYENGRNSLHHDSEHLDTHVGMYENGRNSLHASISPRLSHGNTCMTYSGLSMASNIASSDGDMFENEASSFLAFAGAAPQNVNLALAQIVHWPQQTRASPLHGESGHCMNTAWAGKNPKDCEADQSEDTVTFLVQSSTTNIEDGYMWRKYGQKNIKDRVHPRSYFRCAQQNCPIKKQTESSSDEKGFVLVTYIGRHNHQSQ